MRVTREEVEALRKTERPKMWPDEMRRPYAEPQILKQAQVATSHLTSDPAWDVFLQRVQALIEHERKALAAMSTHMLANMTSEQILQAHRHMAVANAKVEAWEQVLRLPNAILGGTEAPEATAA